MFRRYWFFLLVPFLLLNVCTTVTAQEKEEFTWLPQATYDPEVPTPSSVLGFEIGTYLTDHHQMVDYVHQLESSSPRIKVVQFGRSVQGRDMYLVIATSPENHQRLEEIRERVALLTDPREIALQEARQIASETPAIGWLNFANDGNETAAFEAAIQLAYQLAAGQDQMTLEILDQVVTVLNMAANPDSHQAFVAWMKATMVGREGTADPVASEHLMQWFVSSDGNHFLIDSNRDAFALTQIETRANAEMLHHWNPQVWVDNHGEPNEYTFAPFTTPMNLNYPPELRRWATEIGRNTARHFDQFGWTFVKDETYDLFYPGYWDSYPALNGAVAATYETNGGGKKGLQWEKPDGTLSTMRRAVHSHFIANMATLETLAQNREAFLNYFHDFYRTGMEELEQEPVKAYVLRSDGDPGRMADLVELLGRHEIEVFQLQEGREINGMTYFDSQAELHSVPSGSFVIPLRQPRKRMVKALFEKDPELEERFVLELEGRRARDRRLGTAVAKEGHEFYDVTAWSLPMVFGLDSVRATQEISLENATRIEGRPSLTGGVQNGRAGYAYLFSWETDAGARLAGTLLQEGYRLAMMTRPARLASGVELSIGTFIARVERNEDSLHSRVSELASRYEVEVQAVDTAWVEEGITLGSRKVVDLKQPRILVMTNEPTFAVAYGSVYSLLYQRYGLNFTPSRPAYFRNIDLSRYNVIIFPDGDAEDYRYLLRPEGIENLRQWIEDGGTFIGIRGGARFAELDQVDLTDVEIATEVGVNDEETLPIERVPGAIFRAETNPDYYLAYNQPEQIPVQFRGNWVLTPTRRGVNVVAFPDESHLGGHRWPETEKALQDKVYLADVPTGRGHVILFTGDPTFRAYWRGLDRLFLAGALLSTAF